ncbi:DUF1552 domain-containing protein [Tundrisphaera sp. TA3]|uniref:DUF1552 domain-containing protein n=1 Tax=Tundrisphaera sp. TA3 TaxID=3435775 RepID=UPI003EBF694B
MSRPSRTITRRTMLRGAGVLMGLPLLDAMQATKALGRLAGGAAAPGQPVRMACLFFPNGVNAKTWTPEQTGSDYALTKTLQPLEAVKDQVLVLTNLSHRATDTGDGHYAKDAAWLTGTTIHRTTGSALNARGTSIDQIAAKRVGHFTPLPSLELGVEPVTTGVDTNVGYTRLYGSHISWSTPTTPLAREIKPKLAFDRLFRPDSARRTGTQADDDRSILDLVGEDARALRQRVGQDDRRRIDEYLESVRAVEARIAHEASGRRALLRDDPAARAAIAELGGRIDAYHNDPGRARERRMDHTPHARLMLDLMVLAFQTDSTRIATFMFGNAVSGKNFSFLEGVSGSHHEMSHHENDASKLDQYERISRWHVEQYAYMLDRMRSIREGEGTLLDNSLVLFGSALRDGNSHNPHNLPTLLGGKGAGAIAPGRHLSYAKDTPMANLFVSMLDRVGAPVDHVADSTGPLPGLDDPGFRSADPA